MTDLELIKEALERAGRMFPGSDLDCECVQALEALERIAPYVNAVPPMDAITGDIAGLSEAARSALGSLSIDEREEAAVLAREFRGLLKKPGTQSPEEAYDRALEDFAMATGNCSCGKTNCPAERYASIARRMKGGMNEQ